MRPDIGSVSSGTMRIVDLVPVFLAVIQEYAPKVYAKIVTRNQILVNAILESQGDSDLPEEADSFLHEDLFDAMQNLAPENAYFGAAEGDSSDFGFWECDSDEYLPYEPDHALPGI
jgi:hypothetical protein